MRDPRQFLDLFAYFADRDNQLFSGERNRLNIVGGLRRRRQNLCRQIPRRHSHRAKRFRGRFELGRGRRYRAHYARDRVLERAGDIADVGAALFGDAFGCLFLGAFQLLDADQLLLERLRRASIVADFVAAAGIGDFDIFIAMRELQQHLADASDRPADGKRTEDRDTAQHGDHKQTHAEIDPADALTLRARLGIAQFGGINQFFA